MGNLTFAWIQAAAELEGRLAWIAWAETATAAGTVLLAIMGLGLAVAGIFVLRAVNRALRSLERAIERLAPQTEPLLESVRRVADDAADVSRRVRQNADQVNDTLEELNGRLRSAIQSAEERVRHFGAVLDAVQAEVEEVLLDAAAAARGLHAAAATLRAPRRGRARRREAADDD